MTRPDSGPARRIAPILLGLMLGAAPATADDAEDRDRPAMERFLAVLEKSPRRGTALDRVYGFHVERGTLDPLVQGYRDRLAREPADGTAALLLGLVESQRGRDAAAVAAFRAAEGARPDDPLPSYYLGQALVLVGQPEAAAEAFERALLRHPTRADLLDIFGALARVHQRARRDDQALAAWTRLERLFPDDPRVGEQIAAALVEEGKLAPALARYDAMAGAARDPYRRVRFRTEAADLKVRLGRQADALRDYESVLAGLDPESWIAREVRRKIEDAFARDDDPAGLARYYETWVEKHPDDVDAMTRLGKVLAGLGRSAEARDRFDRALRLAPSRKPLRLALIEQLAHDRKFAEAAAQYEAMARLDPANPDLIRDWGRMLLRDGSRPEADRKAAAAAVWRRLVEARPDDPSAAAQVADLFRQAGMVDEAIALYRRAVDLAPASAQYREYLGEYFHTLKRPADALLAWRAMAGGPGRTAANLGRVGEVLANFGYKAEAADALADAATLDPSALPLRLRRARLLVDLRRFDEADALLVAAGPLAADEGERDQVVADRIALDDAAGRLPARIDALQAGATGPGGADPAAWRTLARYQEAARRPVDATASAERSAALDGSAVATRALLARLYEATGRFGEAADASRSLASLDRRARSEHLSNVAKLEARLGRKDEALQAGREVLAASPGSPEALGTYADLCFALGEDEEGIRSLRRAARSDGPDAKALLHLADVLAREFRTEEAIELFWKAFERSDDLDARLGHVARLAELYLRRNGFDRLVARLEKRQGEEGKRREATFFLAQAYATLGDFGAARLQLESLLEANGRDTGLLKQLSKLAEDEGDAAAALQFQQRLDEVAPSGEVANRLVQLALKAGEIETAEAVWARSADLAQDPGRVLAALDGLRGSGRFEAVLATTGRLLRADPGNWELLYREGRALAALGRPAEAAARDRAILDLRRDDDEVGAMVKARRKAAGGAATARAEMAGLDYRITIGPGTLRAVAGISVAGGFTASASSPLIRSWAPVDYGAARMAALAFGLADARRSGTEAAWLAARRETAGGGPITPRGAWDDFYLALATGDNVAAYESARALIRAVGVEPASGFAFLNAMMQRSAPAGVRQIRDLDAGTDARPALPAGEIDLVLGSLHSLLKAHSTLLGGSAFEAAMGELKRAGRLGDFDADYAPLIAGVNDPNSYLIAANAAAGRGDADAARKLAAAFYRMPSGGRTAGTIVSSQPYFISTPQGLIMLPTGVMARVIRPMADAGRHGEILQILDDALATALEPARVLERDRVSRSTAAGPAPTRVVYFNFLVDGNLTTAIDYPTPNRHVDGGMILLLRTAWLAFKRDGKTADLLAYLRKKADDARADAAAERLARLSLAALLWWSDDRDGAVQALARAVELTPGDVDLKLQLAELQSLRRQPEEALALVDSIEAVDQDATRRREWLALRLGVQAARPERARQAAERLFGLRLDPAMQLGLAGQMQRLGMADLADAVLARARRQVGNNLQGQLDLMAEYRRQGNADAAAQVALQVLRRSLGANRLGTVAEEAAPRLAIEALAASGQLEAMIARVEGQVRTSPRSLTLLQTLAAYQQAAGRLDQLRATNEAIIGLRPDDVALRMQVANQLAASGDVPAAVAHYRAALKLDPSALSTYSRTILATLQQAGRIDELVKLLDEIGLKNFDSRGAVLNLAQVLLARPKTEAQGIALMVKACEAYPDDRASFLPSAATVDAFWARADALDLARSAIVPRPDASAVETWAGLDNVVQAAGWGHDGRITTLATRLLDVASRAGRLDDLAGSIEAALARQANWRAGKALLASVRVRQGRIPEAKVILEPLLASPGSSPPYEAFLTIGQEIRDIPGLGDLALKCYEQACKAERAITYASIYTRASGHRQLAVLQRQAGRGADAVAGIVAAESPLRNLLGSITTAAGSHRRLQALGNFGELYLELGDPADALRLFDEVAAAPDEIQLARTYTPPSGLPPVDALVDRIRAGTAAALGGINPDDLAPTLAALVRPDDPARPVDLRPVVHPREVDLARVESLLASALDVASQDPAARAKLRGDLDRVARDHPDDFEARIALALLASRDADPAALLAAALDLDRRLESAPLLAGDRPTTRRRDEAGRRMGAWLVARACWAHDATAEVGDRLADRALDAARLQLDPAWTLAMLRERGQRALDRGDRPAAEGLWSALLDRILEPEFGPAAPPRPDGPGPRARVAATPVGRFARAAEFARLAADRGFAPLSFRALRETLQGGPPAAPIAPTPATTGLAQRVTAATGEPPIDPVARQVEARLIEIDALWTKASAPPIGAYEAIRDAVLPAARPLDVFLYDPIATPTRGQAQAQAQGAAPAPPTEVARLLARRALAAGRAADLRERVAARRANAGARVAADRLLRALDEAEKGP